MSVGVGRQGFVCFGIGLISAAAWVLLTIYSGRSYWKLQAKMAPQWITARIALVVLVSVALVMLQPSSVKAQGAPSPTLAPVPAPVALSPLGPAQAPTPNSPPAPLSPTLAPVPGSDEGPAPFASPASSLAPALSPDSPVPVPVPAPESESAPAPAFVFPPASSPASASEPGPAASPPAPPPEFPPPVPSESPEPSDAAGQEEKAGEGGDTGNSGLSGGAKAGIAVGVILFAAGLAFGVYVYKKRKENIRRAQYNNAAATDF